MSENTPVVNQSAVSLFQQSSDISDIPQRAGYLPYLTIAYGTSAAVDQGIAAPGDFVFEGKTSFGKSVEVIVADFRLHLSVWNDNTQSTESDCYSHSSDPQRGKSENYINFQKQKLAPSCKLHEGIDLLLWIPAVNSFAVIYLKSTTYDSFAAIYNNGRGGRLVRLTTRGGVSKKTGRKFFLIDCVATNRAVAGSGLTVPGSEIICDVSIPVDFAVAAVQKFKEAKSTEIASAEDASTNNDR